MIEVIRGDDLYIPFEMLDGNDVPIDLTLYTLWFTVRKSVASTTTKTDDDAVITIKQTGTDITNPLAGKTIFTLTSDMTDIKPDTYIYDFQIKTDTGYIYSTIADKFVVLGDSTRDR